MPADNEPHQRMTIVYRRSRSIGKRDGTRFSAEKLEDPEMDEGSCRAFDGASGLFHVADGSEDEDRDEGDEKRRDEEEEEDRLRGWWCCKI
ncbi:hypothetical protein NL676_033963 [Syzygium grande]|nr:hypothetical protein NL676_033963 [Syzygium grande]